MINQVCPICLPITISGLILGIIIGIGLKLIFDILIVGEKK